MPQKAGLNERGRAAFRWLARSGATATDGLSVAVRLHDLRSPDPEHGEELADGVFAFAGGRQVVDDLGHVWDDAPLSPGHADWLHGFSWLRDLTAFDDGDAAARAQTLADAWIAKFPKLEQPAWDVAALTARIPAWLRAAPFLFADDAGATDRLASLARQVRHLDGLSSRAVPDGKPRLDRTLALAAAGVCLTDHDKLRDAALERLASELERQVLPDGGYVSRSPQTVTELLADLITLDEALRGRSLSAPEAMTRAIARMAAMARFFQMPDGGLPAFHGGGEGDRDLLEAALSYDGTPTKAFGVAPHSGFHRLEASGATLMLDVGQPAAPPFGAAAHSSPLAFEFAATGGRMFVNCGWCEGQSPRMREPVRATAAHTALVIDDTNAARLGERPKRERVEPVRARRNEDDLGVWLEASHDGYRAAHGLVHRRRFFLAAKGGDLRGEDTLFRPVDEPVREDARPVRFAVRFHLHPAVRVTLARDGRSAFLVLPDGDGWRFRTDCGPLSEERSIYLADGDEPTPTRQIAITGVARHDAPLDRPPNRIRWALKRIGRAPGP